MEETEDVSSSSTSSITSARSPINPNLILYMNLTGELVYIVSHRMSSQGIKPELQRQVFNDLGAGICHPDLLQHLRGGKRDLIHEPFPRVRALLDSIVHSTSMSISEYSMDKLFELTLIATKYQYTVVELPTDILLIALNHLDSLRAKLTEPEVIGSAQYFHEILVETYGSQSEFTMATLRDEIRTYVRDVNLKMTNLLNLGLQLPNGEFTKMPFKGTARTKIMGQDHDDLTPRESRPPASLELYGDRFITLGLSIYDLTTPLPPWRKRETPPPGPSAKETITKVKFIDPEAQAQENKLKAVQGLEFCSTLLAGVPAKVTVSRSDSRASSLATIDLVAHARQGGARRASLSSVLQLLDTNPGTPIDPPHGPSSSEFGKRRETLPSLDKFNKIVRIDARSSDGGSGGPQGSRSSKSILASIRKELDLLDPEEKEKGEGNNRAALMENMFLEESELENTN